MSEAASKQKKRFNYGWTLVFALGSVLAPALAAQPASAQTLHVLYNFTGQNDGANPAAGVTLDGAGNLYGTAATGGSSNCSYDGIVGCGTVFKLTHRGSAWLFAPLHGFTGNPDGGNPAARVVFGPRGILYGTTAQGGLDNYGTVFQLQPPSRICPTPSCPWSETQLYSFQGPYQAANPGGGDLAFDAQGNIYGTTLGGGGYLCDDQNCGTAYELSPDGQGGWSFTASAFDGGISYGPVAGLVRDTNGSFYGVTPQLPGGLFQFAGTINLLNTFSNATGAVGGLVADSAGNLYGTTSQGGTNGGGIVFEFVPSTSSLTTLYNLTGSNNYGAGPTSTLVMDAAGNLYGTTHTDGAFGQGSVFKLTHSGGNWSLTTLHNFTGLSDGGQPFGQLTIDASGNLYGTTTLGGSSLGHCYLGVGCGVVFEITPN